MSELCFREHAMLARNSPESECGGISYANVLRPSLRAAVDKEVDYLSQATHAVLHFTDEGSNDQLSVWKTDWKLQKVQVPCLIMLMVSQGGKAHLETALHQKWESATGKNVGFVLYARNQEEALGGDTEAATKILQAFYSMTRENAEAVCSERLADCPEALRRLFERPEPPSVLPALSILCQGYLIVHAKHGHANGIPESLRLAAGQLPSVPPPLTKVNEHAFWWVFDEQDREKVVTTVKSEWDRLTGVGDLGAVQTLIRGLPTKDKPLKDEDVPMVAKAYAAIAAQMGAESGV